MQKTTLREIIDGALDRADFADDSEVVTNAGASAGFIKRSSLLRWANLELAKLHHHVTESYEEWDIKKNSFDLVPNQEDYDLPTDFYKHRKVFFVSAGKRYRIYRFTLDEIPIADRVGFPGTVWGFGFRYRIIGDKISFIPNPNSGTQGNIEHWYVPQFEALTGEDQMVPARFPFGWQEYVELGLCIRMLKKEESDVSQFVSEQQEKLMEVINAAGERDTGEANRVNDVSERWASARYWRWGE